MFAAKLCELGDSIGACSYDNAVLVYDEGDAVFLIMDFLDEFGECFGCKTAVNDIILTVSGEVFSHHNSNGVVGHTDHRA